MRCGAPHHKKGKELKKGGGRTIGRKYKVHLDVYNSVPYLTGQKDNDSRREIIYFSGSSGLTALCYND
ncbi:MAG: hypothetical protein KJP23_26790 [Deltaproteobacteria bacterium]|nr:hypothetical protein [Deltaproteobacteria bacterium]